MKAPLLAALAVRIDPSTSDYIEIGIAAGLAALIILVFWILLPPYVRRTLQAIDNLIPADLSGFTRIASRWIIYVLSAAVLASAGLSIAASLGAEMSGVLRVLENFGKDVLTTAVPRLLRVMVIAFIAWLAIRALRRAIPTIVSRFLTMRMDSADQMEETEKRTRTLDGVLRATVNFTIITIAFLIILTELEINVAPLLAGAGVVGLAIGFGAQSLIRDMLSGIFIMLEDQYRVGDVVRIGGVAGLVEDINLRRTTLRDLDFIVHVIPNGEVRIASNFTKEKSRVNLDIEVAYKEDMDHVMEVLNRVGTELAEDPYFGPLHNEPIQVLRVNEFAASGIAIKVLGETKPIRQWEVAGEFRKRIKKAFDDEGIEIPFPHRTIYWGTGEETRVRQILDQKQAEMEVAGPGVTSPPNLPMPKGNQPGEAGEPG